MLTIKTRFAPSPTGDLHIGGLRTALYNYLFAKKNNGKFVLRIEDTDRARFKKGSVETILTGLKWVGIKTDGKIIYQSLRTDIYKKYAEQLIVKNKAYYCFCSAEILNKIREEQIKNGNPAKYDRRCLKLSKKEIEEKIKNNDPYVVRLIIPDGKTKFKDLIREEVEFNNREIDDQVLLKSDGYPTYHLANVVDDHKMKISHVIRAEEWLSSTPKHIILYEYFGWKPPKFAHIPMVLASDKSKLSKRHGATGVLEFKKQGYLPEAIINFLAFLGWNPGDSREIFSMQELIKEFSIEKVQKGGAIFNIEKLNWINGQYIRKLNIDKLTKLCISYFEKKKSLHSSLFIKQIVALEQNRLKKLSDIAEFSDFFFKNKLEYDKDLLKWKNMNNEELKNILEKISDIFSEIPENDFTKEKLEPILKSEAVKIGDNGKVFWPLRVALSGKKASPGPMEIAEILGKEKSVERVKSALEKIK
ncbi:MAG: glutamate--tRNA ligase [Patescibacteria group bacterium]